MGALATSSITRISSSRNVSLAVGGTTRVMPRVAVAAAAIISAHLGIPRSKEWAQGDDMSATRRLGAATIRRMLEGRGGISLPLPGEGRFFCTCRFCSSPDSHFLYILLLFV